MIQRDTSLLNQGLEVKINKVVFEMNKWLINNNILDLKVEVFETFRSRERSNELYKKGLCKASPSGYSYHNYSLACDIVFKKKYVQFRQEEWDWTWSVDRKYWNELGEIGESFGLEWGGRWKGKNNDCPHFQLSYGIKIHELLNNFLNKKEMIIYDEIFRVDSGDNTGSFWFIPRDRNEKKKYSKDASQVFNTLIRLKDYKFMRVNWEKIKDIPINNKLM